VDKALSRARYRRNFDLGSPSRQVKRNALGVKRAVDSIESLSQKRIWIEAIVVFADQNVMLHVNDPTVPVLRTNQLPNYIITKKLSYRLAPEEINIIGKTILKLQN
jgi:hypothetical protein